MKQPWTRGDTLHAVVHLAFLLWLSFHIKWGYEWWITVGTLDRLQRIRQACLLHDGRSLPSGHARDVSVFLADLDEKLDADSRPLLVKALGRSYAAMVAGWPHDSRVLANPAFDELARDADRFFQKGADRARLLYESRSVMSYAETAVIGSISIFLPLLVFLWNNAREKFTSRLQWISTAPLEQRDALAADAIAEWEALNGFGAKMRPSFMVTLFFVVVLIVAFAQTNLATAAPRTQYLAAIVLNGAAFALIMWLFALLVLYLLIVQPVLGGNFDSLVMAKLTSRGDQKEDAHNEPVDA